MDVLTLCLFVGSLGYQAIVYGNGLKWYQANQGLAEEEEDMVMGDAGDDSTHDMGVPDSSASESQHRFQSSIQGNSEPNTPRLPEESSVTFPRPQTLPDQSPLPTNPSDTPSPGDQSIVPPTFPLSDPRLTGWEYKIVRAQWDLFRDPRQLQRLCTEEADAGWIMIEKLDDRRIRFKRPIARRQMPTTATPIHDPYRSYYGSPLNLAAWFGVVAAVTAILLPAYLGYALVFKNTYQQRSRPAVSPSPALSSPSLP